MRTTIAIAGLLLVALPASADPLEEQARALHRDAVVIDGHNDAPTLMLEFGFDLGMDGSAGRGHWLYWDRSWLPWRPAGSAIRTDTDLERMKQGGLDAQFFSIWVSPHHYDPRAPGRATARALAMIEAVREQARRHPQLELATTAADVRRIATAGRHAALMGIEGGHAIEDSLDTLRRYHGLGVRYLSLTWSFTHSWADSSGYFGSAAEPVHGGLTDFGREVVREMNRLGMMVDVSHASDDTFWDALETSRAPIIASHSSARALVDHHRNLSDEMLRAVAHNRGVVMVNFAGFAVDPRKRSRWQLAKSWIRHLGDPATPLSMVADHVEHVIAVAGIDHVGLGSDFDGTPILPAGLDDVDRLPNLTVELARRGYTEGDLRKILGENLLRVMREVEAVAAADAGR